MGRDERMFGPLTRPTAAPVYYTARASCNKLCSEDRHIWKDKQHRMTCVRICTQALGYQCMLMQRERACTKWSTGRKKDMKAKQTEISDTGGWREKRMRTRGASGREMKGCC